MEAKFYRIYQMTAIAAAVRESLGLPSFPPVVGLDINGKCVFVK